MDAAAESALRAVAAPVDAIVIAEVPFGHGNLGNLRAAVESGTPLVLVGDIAGRDFTGGAAEALWKQALSVGATTVARIDDADHALAALVPERNSP